MSDQRTSDMSPAVAELIEGYAEALPNPLSARERAVESGLALVALGIALALTRFHAERSLSLVDLTLLLLAYAIAKRVRFAVGAGYTIPTQLVFVPMLFVLPTPLVPLIVIGGIALGNLPGYLRRQVHPDRLLLIPGDALYAVPPVLVILLGHAQTLSWSHWPIYVAALAAQCLCDPLLSSIREWLALGVHPSLQPRMLGWVAAVDALLAPIGLLAGLAGTLHRGGWLLVLPLLALLELFAVERRARIDNALELG